MRPVVFDECAGWLHGDRASHGVVLLAPHGFEELCSRRFMRCLAEALAQAGLPTLRFDYHGTGDSAGCDEDPRRPELWLSNVHAAIERLKQDAGVRELTLVGLRLGAMLAMQAAAARSDVQGLALLAPPASGKAYVREQIALGRVIGAGLPPAPPSAETAFDGVEVAGFRTTAATLEALRAFAWEELSMTSARDALVVGGRESAGRGPNAHLAQLGVRVSALPFSGYDRLMCDPTASELPSDVVDAVRRWAVSVAGASITAPMSTADAPSIAPRLKAPAWIEERVTFGPNEALAAVYCRPTHSQIAASRTFVFLNAGAISHIGWARMTVEDARRLASAGFASLRVDLAGVGDSAEPARARQFLYSKDAKADVLAALNWLEARGHRNFAIVGGCSGAFQAFHAAVADARVQALVLINQLCFIWGASYALTLSSWKMARSVEAVAQRRADRENESGAAGPVYGTLARLLGLAKKAARGTLGFAHRASLATMLFGEGGANPVARWFEKLSARGTEIVLVQGTKDGSRDELARYMGPDAKDVLALPGVRLLLIEGTDHTLTPRHARQALSDQLLAVGQSPAARSETARVPASPPALPGLAGTDQGAATFFLSADKVPAP